MKQNHPFTLRHTLIFVAVAVIVITLLVRYGHIFQSHPVSGNTDLLVPGIQVKQEPREITFRGCPPEGSGGDEELNRLKNRVDEGSYQAVKFDPLRNLSWPHAVERRKRSEWASDLKSEIARNEGDPIAVEGYLLRVKEEGPESPNCRREDPDFRDFHIWLAYSPDDEESSAIVVEITPRIRIQHPSWNLQKIRTIIRERVSVRISGWLLFDQEHPDQVGKSRATLWEIHPIMKIEVHHNGEWIPLDNLPA